MLVLGWHNIDSTPCFPSERDRGLRGFIEQLEWLQRRATVVPLAEGLRRLRTGAPLPRRAVAITFDDGYRDNLELALPELERRGMTATVFLVPGLLDRSVDPWWERIAWAVSAATVPRLAVEERVLPLGSAGERRVAAGVVAGLAKRRDQARRTELVTEVVEQLKPRPGPDLHDLFLDWDGARALASRGVDIGSHSSHHAILSEETPAEQAADLAESRRRLEDELDVPVTSLAYPNGTRRDYDADTVAAAQAAGYVNALTTRKGVNTRRTPAFEIRRVVVYPERGSRLLSSAAQIAARRLAKGLAAARARRSQAGVGAG